PVLLVKHAAASLLLLAIGLGLWLSLRHAMDRGLARLEAGEGRTPVRLLAQARRIEGSAKRLLGVSIALLTVIAILRIWGIDPATLLLAEPALADRVTGIVLILLVSWILWHAAKLAIEFLLLPRSDAAAEAAATRARTLVPVLVGTTRLAIALTAALLVLSEMGLNISPLLAGAGIAGVALGFGAQSLVRDFLTGVFLILEDSLAVGDVVTVAGHSGTVEHMGVRTLRLRDANGTLHSVPYGAITTVENATRDFAHAVIEIGVAYDADLDHVADILRATAAEQRADPALAPCITDDIEILGLDRFADSAVVLKARIRTAPRDRLTVLRDYQARLKRRLDAAGIGMPFPQRTLSLAPDRDGRPPAIRVIAEAPDDQEA
ncbi:MAG: mechanosensitive ion channel family protein, partial [Alphaproteobacteria bacterium]